MTRADDSPKRNETMNLDPATINMIAPWLTGNDEKDAKSLKRTFRTIKMTIGEWRQVVKIVKAAK
jgi:hypothetical protein